MSPAPTTDQLTSLLGGLNTGLNSGAFDATQALAALSAGTGIGSNMGNEQTFANLTFTPEQQTSFEDIYSSAFGPAPTAPPPPRPPVMGPGATNFAPLANTQGIPNLDVPYGADYLDPAANYTLEALRLEEQKRQFDQQYAFDQQQLAQQQSQFDSQLAFDKQVFEQQLAIQQAQQLLDEQQAAEMRRQFDIQQAEQKRQFDQNLSFQAQRLAEEQRQFDTGLQAEQQRLQLQLQENARQFNIGTVSDVAKTMANLRAQGPASAAELAFYQAGLGLPAFGSAANIENLLGATTRGATGSLPLDFNVSSISPLFSMLGGGFTQQPGSPSIGFEPWLGGGSMGNERPALPEYKYAEPPAGFNRVQVPIGADYGLPEDVYRQIIKAAQPSYESIANPTLSLTPPTQIQPLPMPKPQPIEPNIPFTPPQYSPEYWAQIAPLEAAKQAEMARRLEIARGGQQLSPLPMPSPNAPPTQLQPFPVVPPSEGNPIQRFLSSQSGYAQPMINIPNTLSGAQLSGLNANPNLAGVTASFARAAGNPDIFTRSINALVPSGFSGVGSPYG